MDFTKYAIRYWCDLNPGTGYNNAARGYLQAFKRLGLNADHVHLAPAVLSDFGRTDEDLFDWTRAYTHRVSADEVVAASRAGTAPPPVWDDSRAKINIVHLSPGLLAGRSYVTKVGERYNVAITAWETDTLPKRPARRENGRSLSVVDALNEYDEVWVPSRWNRDVFEAEGVASSKLHVVRHALLDELLAFEAQPWDLRPFTFYSIGTWNSRKDPALLLGAYFATGWNPTTPVELQLYCVPPTRDSQVMWAHQERAQRVRVTLIESLVDPTSAPAHGLHTSKYVNYDEVIARHLRGSVLVSASHGEAFGLPLLEALALGRGVIAGGPWVEELAEVAGRFENGGLIDVLPTHKVPVVSMPDCAGYEIGQSWWDADTWEMQAAIRCCYEAYAKEPLEDWSEALRSAAKVRQHYSPDAVSEVLAERLHAIHKVLDGTGW